MLHNKSFTDVLRRLLVVIGCVVLAAAQPMSAFAGTAATDPQRAPDTIIFPKGSTEKPAAMPISPIDTGVGGGAYMLVVLTLAGAGAWLLWRRRAGGSPFGGKDDHKLVIQETRNLGNRQYLVVATYEGKKFLLGVTSERIQMLTTLPDEGRQE